MIKSPILAGKYCTGFTDDTGYFLIKSGNGNKVLDLQDKTNVEQILLHQQVQNVVDYIGETPTFETLGLGTPEVMSVVVKLRWMGKRTIGTGKEYQYETLVTSSSITGDSKI